MTKRRILLSTAGVRRCLLPLLCCAAGLFGQTHEQRTAPLAAVAVHARAILGVENIPNNAAGELSLQNDALLFQLRNGRASQVSIGSIQNVFFSQQDKQMGGTPVALGRAAIPLSGGRVVALLAHKKYDFVTFEYRDVRGGQHDAIWQMNRDQARSLIDELTAKGVRVDGPAADIAEQRQGAENEPR